MTMFKEGGELLRAYAAGGRDFKYWIVGDAYVSHDPSDDLRGADLRGADFTSADFRGADLRGADFRRSDLTGVRFRGADLRGADFRHTDMWGASLSSLIGRGSPAKNETFMDAYAPRAFLVEGERDTWHALITLAGADFRWAKFGPIRITGVDFRGADFRAVEWKAEEGVVVEELASASRFWPVNLSDTIGDHAAALTFMAAGFDVSEMKMESNPQARSGREHDQSRR